MARPRKRPELTRSSPRLSEGEGLGHNPTSLKVRIINAATSKIWNRQAGETWPTKSGYFDPLSLMLVVEMLMRTEGDTYIVARDLTRMLENAFPQQTWRAVVVGRILSDLAEAANATDATPRPIEKTAGQGGHDYLLNVNPENWRWLGDVREVAGRLFERALDDARRGTYKPPSSFPFEEFDTIEFGRSSDTDRA
jgi:hypothetical protein